VNSEEGLDRAGAYSIQQRGAVLVQRIEGDYNTVVGFPASAFYRYMSEMLESKSMRSFCFLYLADFET